MLRRPKRIPKARIVTKSLPFKGGLDTETPMLDSVPGRLRNSQNVYQGVNSSYWTFPGYERFDGRTSPSSAAYGVLTATITGSLSLGDVLTDDATTSYGTVIAITDSYVALTKITGTFSTGNVKVATVTVGTCVGAQVVDGASTKKLHAQYKNLAADIYRADIGKVAPSDGDGDVTGIWFYDGEWYGFRNNAAGTAAAMFKATTSGWTAVDLGYEVAFTSGGTYEILDGDLLEGDTSGATATVTRVIMRAGSFAAGTAIGTLVIASQTGTFESETLSVGPNAACATITGDFTAITLAEPDGQFEFKNTNFTGSIDTFRMYGVDGKNRGFEFDGTVFAPISTGMTIDAPEHITEHKYHLFYSFVSGVQHSSTGYPFEWSIVTGHDEIGLGDDITAMVPQIGSESGGAIALYTRNSFGVLYGSSTDDWNLVHNRESRAGAIEWSAQSIGNTFTLDDRGITKLTTTQVYGNFADATVSQIITTWLTTKKTQLTASCISRDRNQYWLFFADKSALCCTVDNGEVVAMCPMLFEHKVTCVCSTEDESGNEVIMFGSDDGYVYQMFKGTSFDGDAIEWYMEHVFNHFGSPTINKRFSGGMFEVKGAGYTEFGLTYKLSYEDSNTAQPGTEIIEIALSSEKWDASVAWDSSAWDGVSLGPSYFKLKGSGTNISLILNGNNDYNDQLKFSGALIQFTPTKEIK